MYYPVLNPDHDDIDYINFKDIINKSWSIPLDNLSAEDIQLELSFLKHQKTSSPKIDMPSSPTSPDSIDKDNHTTSNNDDEKTDPTYELPKKRKASKCP